MSIQSLTNIQTCTESRRPSSRPGGTPCASFRARLEQAGTPQKAIHLCIGEDVVSSGGHAGAGSVMQEFCAHYTEDSTPEDPIVRITGVGNGGPFDFLCHINDVNPANASYAELAALRGHLLKTGACQSGGHTSGPLPCTMDFQGDIARKHNFIAEIRESLAGSSPMRPTASGILEAKELLALYQNYASGDSALSARSAESPDHGAFVKDDPLSGLTDARLLLLERAKEGKAWKKEQEEWERLMKSLDSWIDALRDAADWQREGRSGGIAAEGGEALLSIYRNLIAGAARTEAASSESDPGLAGKELLSALTKAQAALLERLREDRDMEEEREAWEDLLRRLDNWIEALRGEEDRRENADRRENVDRRENADRPDAVSAVAGGPDAGT